MTTLLPAPILTDAMDRALAAAREAGARGEVPVGAVVLDPTGALLATAGNRVETEHDPSAHAELCAMRAAARLRARSGAARLTGCTVVVTLEPCPMCAAAMVHFRIARVIFGAYDPKGGGIDHGPRVFEQPACLHRPDVIGGVREAESAALLRAFFQTLRDTATPP